MAADKQALRQQILEQIDHCAALAYGAGHHFAQHGKHAPSSVMTKADADAKLVRLIEEYARRPAFTEDEIDQLYLSKVAGRGPFDGIRAAFHAMVRTIEQAHGIGADGVDSVDEGKTNG